MAGYFRIGFKMTEQSQEHGKISNELRPHLIKELEARQEAESQRHAKRMLIFIFGLTLMMIGVFFWAQAELVANLFIYGEFDVSDRSDRAVLSNVKIFGGVFILVSTVFFAYLYMVGFSPKKRRQESRPVTDGSSSFEKDSVAIVALLKSINSSLEQGKLESVLSDSERSEIISNISSTVDSHLNESLLSKIEEKYGSAVHHDKLSVHAEEALTGTISRLKEYAEDLSSKASVNLAYGIGATIGAIGILILVLFNASAPDNASNIDTVFYYTSRLFLVLLVQGVSIFFLSLYKTTLNNILYINNEITNYEAKRDSLAVTLKLGDKETTSAMLASLSATERNFTLKKGETSIYDKGNQSLENQSSGAIMAELVSKLRASPNA